MFFRLLQIAVTVVLAISFAHDSYADEKPTTTKLALTPAAEADPALKYQLLPPFLERRSGNAAPYYTKAFLVLANAGIDDAQWEQVGNWLETPPSELPREEVRKTLNRFNSTLVELQLAATRDHCHWESGVRERNDVFGTLMPEVQQFRVAGRMVALKARLDIADGDFDEAVRSLQIGYAMSRGVAAQPFLISGLVGVAMAAQMSQQLELLIAAPDAPNMYWAIASLPRPLIDFRPALELEGATLFLMFPDLQGLEEKELTPHQWRQLWRGVFVKSTTAFNSFQGNPPSKLEASAQRLALTAAADVLIEKRFPAAKKSLIEYGHDAEAVEAMSKSQVVAIDEIETFKRMRDDMFKWGHVPYWQVREGMIATERRIEKDNTDFSPSSLGSFLLPSISAALESCQIADQRLAALQTIEAIRTHAAMSDGQLPKTLADIKSLPIPVNPFTGKQADYTHDAEQKTAVLTSTAPRADRTLRYELQLAK